MKKEKHTQHRLLLLHNLCTHKHIVS